MTSTTVCHILPDNQSSLVVQQLSQTTAVTPEEQAELWALKPTERGTVKIFGKVHPIPRYQLNLGVDYRFSGVTHLAQGPISIHPALVRLQAFVEEHSGLKGWTQCLINFYANGSEYIGPHSDNEAQLVRGAPIYSFSFGGERRFVVHRVEGGPAVLEVPLTDNVCVVMQGAMQQRYKHSVPKTAKVVAPRLNVTFRLYQSE